MITPTQGLAALSILGLALTPAILPAQTRSPDPAPAASSSSNSVPADSGVFIIRHGTDTVATERFTRSATALNGTLAIKNAKSVSQSYQAVVAPDASVPMIELTVREDLDSGRVKGKVMQRARVIFKDDSASVDDINNNGLQTRLFQTERGVIPYLNLSFALLEQAVRRSRAGAAQQVPFFNLGGGQTLDARVTPLGADSLAVALGSVEFHLRVDPAGRVLGGRIPAQEVVADRVGGS